MTSIPKISPDLMEGELDGSPEYFFEAAFDDSDERERLLGVMPVSSSQTPRLPTGTPSYIANLWNTPLLTAEQERHCFRKMNLLKFLAIHTNRGVHGRLGCNSFLDDHDDFLRRAFHVRNQIVEANLRLVVSIAKKYAPCGSNRFEELVCTGNVTLLRAVEKFDFRRGLRFSTYAYQAIQRSIFTELRRERQTRHRLASEETAVEAAAIGDAGACDLAELDAADARDQAIQLIEQLDERDQWIVKSRFGIDRKHNGLPFRMIAKEIGLSPSRTLQLFHRSLHRMRELLAKRQTNPKLRYCV